MPELLMLDPSVFVSTRSFRAVLSGWETGELRDVVVPASFKSAVLRGEFDERAMRYFGAMFGVAPVPASDVAGFMAQSNIEGYAAEVNRNILPEAFEMRLAATVRDRMVLATL